jgi:hypothetical protein
MSGLSDNRKHPWTEFDLIFLVPNQMRSGYDVSMLCGPLDIIHSVDWTCAAWLDAWTVWSLWLLAHELWWTCCFWEDPVFACPTLSALSFHCYGFFVHATNESLHYDTCLMRSMLSLIEPFCRIHPLGVLSQPCSLLWSIIAVLAN